MQAGQKKLSLNKIKPLIKLGVTLGLLALLYRRIDVPKFAGRLGEIRWSWVGVFWLILLVNTAISTVKWRALLRADGIRLSYRTLFSSQLIGSFFNMFLPSTIGGDAYRIVDVSQRSARTANTVASVIADRLSGFLALALYGLILFPVFRSRYNPDPRLFLLPATAFAGLMVVVLALWEQALLRRIAGWLPQRFRAKLEKPLDALLASMRVYGSQPRVMLTMALISFMFQFFAILAVYSISRAAGLAIPLLPFGFFVPFITLMEMIPISIFGIGLRDVGYVWFMHSVAHSSDDAAAMSLLYVAATVIYVSLGGLLYLAKRESSSGAA